MQVLLRAFVAVLFTVSIVNTGYSQPLNEPGAGDTGVSYTDVITADLSRIESKIVSLAGVIPQEKYSWRPDEDVRSFSEVLLHIAGANYFFFTFFGNELPEGMTMDYEKTLTNKDEIIAQYKPAYDYAREKLSLITEEDLSKTYNFFGNEISGKALLLIFSNHAHEHLGQLIAYSRMNGIKPPWSEN